MANTTDGQDIHPFLSQQPVLDHFQGRKEIALASRETTTSIFLEPSIPNKTIPMEMSHRTKEQSIQPASKTEENTARHTWDEVTREHKTQLIAFLEECWEHVNRFNVQIMDPLPSHVFAV